MRHDKLLFTRHGLQPKRVGPMAWAGLFAVVTCIFAMLFAVPSASADLSFCPVGTGAGQCEKPQGVAVDTETGHVYVADGKNNRIDVFDTAGAFIRAFGWGVADGVSEEPQSCTATCFRGIPGSGSGQFNRPVSIAVDNDPASGSRHDIYVTDGSFRVQKFDPEGIHLLSFGSEGAGECKFARTGDPLSIGSGGRIYVADSSELGPSSYSNRVEKFEPTGVCAGEVELFGGDFEISRLAVDSNEDAYVVVENDGGALRKYSLSAPEDELYALDPDAQTEALAVDGSDNLYAFQRQGAINKSADNLSIAEYDSAGAHLRRFGYGAFQASALGLAPYHSAGGEVFVSEEDANVPGPKLHYLAFPPPGPILVEGSAEGQSVRSTRATLEAEVNPEGKATTYRFDYVDQAGFEADGFAGPTVEHSPEGPVGSDFDAHGASFEATGLTPSTKYHFRVVATNVDGSSTAEGEGGEEFETLPSVQIEATWSTEVGIDTAVLHGEANPLGSPATGHFEYVTDAAFQQSGFGGATQVPDVDAGQGALSFGSGEEALSRGISLSPLTPATTYHYRLVVENAFSTLIGEDHTFTTFAIPTSEACAVNEIFRTEASASLADCRAYEMVSPLDKESGDVIPLGEFTTDLPATLDQSSIDGGKLVYGSYRAFGDAESAPFTSQYLAQRGGGGWESHAITPPRGRLNIGATDTLDTELKALSPDLCDAWFMTFAEPPLAPGALEGFLNLYRRRDSAPGCGGAGYEALTTATPPHVKPPVRSLALELQGLSADGSAALYIANDNLPGTAAPNNTTGVTQLYERNGEGLSFVCIQPSEKASKEPCSAGTTLSPLEGGAGQSRSASVNHAISADGRRVFWTSYTPASGGPGQIYVRIDGSETLAVSKAAEEETGASESRFLTAAEDGSKAIFMTAGNLYEYDIATKATHLIARESAGIMGASEDASYLYFVSKEALSGSNEEGKTPAVGRQNLYLDRDGTIGFIALLTEADVHSGEASPISLPASRRLSRISPDGRHAAFMSFSDPTGYDNIDARSGMTDAEIYLYDATADGGAGKLLCASCNPSGTRPVGIDIQAKIHDTGQVWVAAQIPGWENILYASRVLSEDGSRLFFESTDTLSPRDTNGVGDVYEWEEPGHGSCTEASDSYSKLNGGCVSLISSGQSPRDSEFIDASPSGEDVFFATLSSLVPQDSGLVDIYDARVDGGFAPPPGTPAACEGEACQSPPAPPLDLTPGSLSFSGAGNLVNEGQVPVKPRVKSLTRAQQLAKALRACRSRVKKKRACEAKARSRYHARKQAKRSSSARRKAKKTVRSGK